MRTDRLGECSRFEGLPEALNRSQYLVPKLASDQLREAIEGPSALTDTAMEPGLVQQLVVEASEGSDRLPLLQHLLMILWAGRTSNGDGSSLITLAQYRAAGSAAKALNDHADRTIMELPEGRRRTASLIFRALTVGGAGRDLRRPCRLSQLAAETGAPLEEVREVVKHFLRANFFTSPDRELTPDWETDITHESLIRVWESLKQWTDDELRSARLYRRIAETAALFEAGTSGLWRDPELQLALDWKEKEKPTEAWADRYHKGFQAAMRFLEDSRTQRDAENAEKEHRQKRELQQAKIRFRFASLFVLLLLAFGAFAFRSIQEQERHHAEEDKKEREAEKAKDEEKLAQQALVQQAKANEDLQEALDKASAAELDAERSKAAALVEKQAAEKASADALQQATLANQRTDAIVNALNAETTLKEAQDEQSAAQDELRKFLLKPIPRDEKERAKLQQALTNAGAKVRERAAAAVAASATTAAIAAGGSLIENPALLKQGVFDLNQGLEITKTSGSSNPNNMFGSSVRSPGDLDVATFFKDGLDAGFLHWVEWRTREPVHIESVAIIAAHDSDQIGYRFRRAFKKFKLYARTTGSDWTPVADYSPALPYGGTVPGREPSTALAVCLPVKTVLAREFRAEFVQAVNVQNQFSGPRVIKLDGYASKCSK